MGNKYYQAGRERAEKVAELFASIAPRYDLINDLQSFGLHRVWKRRLLRLAAPKPGERALDLCCGTGDIAWALAARGVEVTGLDFSEPMLAVARAKTQKPSRGHVLPPSFTLGDAAHLSFPDNHFDIVTIAYGLRNLANWKNGLAEMWRVAKPGGRLLVLDFGKPDNRFWRGLYFSYLRWFVPMLGMIFCGDKQAYSYILESLQSYPAQHGVAVGMKELGCQDIRILPLLGGAMSINYARKAGS
jgi:demethylmenaquinone methyltransferase/2-methoxy-6-polyprenyl-1,4-benzoquinol methylase